MSAEQFIFLMIGFGLVQASFNCAEQCKTVRTIILAILAWAAHVVPKWLIWPVPDPRDIRWLLFVGAVVIIGSPLVILMASKWKRRPRR